jgi:hypothetical protein
MLKMGFVSMGGLYRRINETRTVLAQGLEECARVPAIFGAGVLIAGIERSVASIRSEVRPVS